MKFGYVFAVSNINSCNENCGRILNTFYRVILKFWVPVFMHVPLSISLCDNTNPKTRTGSITSFQHRPTASKFGTQILRSPQRYFFTNQSRFFSNIFLIHDIFWTNNPIFIHSFVNVLLLLLSCCNVKFVFLFEYFFFFLL